MSEKVRIGFGTMGWRSLFHSNCQATNFGGVVGPDGEDRHILEDGSELASWKCFHCGVRFFAGLDAERRVVVAYGHSDGWGPGALSPAIMASLLIPLQLLWLLCLYMMFADGAR